MDAKLPGTENGPSLLDGRCTVKLAAGWDRTGVSPPN